MAMVNPIANALANAIFLAQSLAGGPGVPVSQGQASTPGQSTLQAPAPVQAPQSGAVNQQIPNPVVAPETPRPAPAPQVVDPYQQVGVAAAGAPAPAAANAAKAAARAAEAANPAQVNDPTTTIARQAAENNAAAAQSQQPSVLGGGQGTGFSAATTTAPSATAPASVSPTQPVASSPTTTNIPAAGTAVGQPPAQQDEPGWFDTLLNNLSGQNLRTPEDLQRWRQLQTLGVVGNKLGAALGAGNPVIEGFGNAMGDVFAGNLASKNAELREISQQDALNKILAAMGGVKTPSGATPTPFTSAAGNNQPGTTSGGRQLGGVSALASGNTGFTPPSNQGTTTMDDLIGSISKMRI